MRLLFSIMICFSFAISVCHGKEMSMNSDCHYGNRGAEVTCDVVVESIKGDAQFIELPVPNGVASVNVSVDISVGDGSVYAWLDNTQQDQKKLMVESSVLSSFSGIATVRPTLLNDESAFRLYLEPKSNFFLKKAENIKITIYYAAIDDQRPSHEENLDPVEKLTKLVNEQIDFVPSELGKVAVVGDQDNKYVATQLFRPFESLRPEVQDYAASLGWLSGEMVRFWVLPDWTFQVCNSNLQNNESCN